MSWSEKRPSCFEDDDFGGTRAQHMKSEYYERKDGHEEGSQAVRRWCVLISRVPRVQGHSKRGNVATPTVCRV